MTLWPTWFERSVCQTPMTPVTIGIATIPATSDAEQPHVLLGNRDVEHLPQEERRDDADRGGEDDEREDDTEPRAVRTEEREDPAQVRLPDAQGRTAARAARPKRRRRSVVQARL